MGGLAGGCAFGLGGCLGEGWLGVTHKAVGRSEGPVLARGGGGDRQTRKMPNASFCGLWARFLVKPRWLHQKTGHLEENSPEKRKTHHWETRRKIVMWKHVTQKDNDPKSYVIMDRDTAGGHSQSNGEV